MENNNNNGSNIVVDARGKACPTPVIMTKKAVESAPGKTVKVIVDNEVAKENVSKFAASINYKVGVESKEGLFYLTLTPLPGAAQGVAAENLPDVIQCETTTESQPYVVVVTTDTFGQGDPALGKLLMKNYIYAIKELERKPSSLIFLNRGVFLTTEGSEVINDLKELETAGVEIISCGTCLDYYQLKEKLQVGSVGNMYTIAEKMSKNKAVVL